MSESTSSIITYLGKPVKDDHGHVIGTMASFLATPGGRIDGVFIEHGDGSIKRYSRDQIKTENNEIILYSTLKMKANNFCNQIPLLWRKTQALKELNEKRKIPEDMYGDLYASFEGALNQLKTEAEDAIAEIDNELQKCNRRIKELNSALINLELEKEIGQIDEESYLIAIELVKEGLKRANAEKNDFKDLKSKLDNNLLGETKVTEEEQPVENQTESTPDLEPLSTPLPEPPESSGESPVVVYVKNVDNPNP
ncbi:CdvA-like protein [Candidatus Bathyarchaeota archaeon]|nr:CdvA-like protein [Candidatus Bathyarchaeota archaeon]